MIKLSRRNFRVLTYLSLFAAVSSFIIAESLSVNNRSREIHLNNSLATGLPTLTKNLFAMGGKKEEKTNQKLQPTLVKPPAKKDQPVLPVDKYNLKPQAFNVPASFQGKIINEVKVAEPNKVIALTFDDGPWPKNTNQILEILKKNNIKATFFWIGRNLEEYPEIAKQVVADGHAIGNHTWSHSYRKMSEADAAKEINKTGAIIERVTKVKTALFRPPGGRLNNGPANYALWQKYVVLLWSCDTTDYVRKITVNTIVNKALKNAKPGGMVLMHDGGGDRSHTVQALPTIISSLKKQGYKFVTVPQLLTMQQSSGIAGTRRVGGVTSATTPTTPSVAHPVPTLPTQEPATKNPQSQFPHLLN